jgi:hypothetical protein
MMERGELPGTLSPSKHCVKLNLPLEGIAPVNATAVALQIDGTASERGNRCYLFDKWGVLG